MINVRTIENAPMGYAACTHARHAPTIDIRASADLALDTARMLAATPGDVASLDVWPGDTIAIYSWLQPDDEVPRPVYVIHVTA